MKAFNGEARSVAKFDGYNDTLYGAAWKSQFLSGLMMPIMSFIGNLGYVAVAILGGWLAVRNAHHRRRHPGLHPVRAHRSPSRSRSSRNISNVLQQTAAAAERVFEFLAEPEEIARHRPSRCSSTACAGQVEFRDVHFGYTPGQDHHQRLLAPASSPGSKIAIVGPTGAGKTTMVKLLMRFYDVNSGAILVDGHDIREFTRSDLRAAVRHGAAGHLAVQRHDHGEHPLRPAGRDRRGGDRRGEGRARRPLRPHAARRLPHGAQRGGEQRLAGADAAADHRPRRPGRPEDPDPGRGDQLGGHAHRGADPEGDGQR